MAEQVSYLERVKLQAQVLVPVVRHLQRELGDERARSLMRAALADYGREIGQQIRSGSAGTGVEKVAAALPLFQAGGALEVETVDQSATALNFNVKRCSYAAFFREIGAQDLGELLCCDLDFPMAEAAGVRLERSQTIMGGADHCDFRWSAKAD